MASLNTCRYCGCTQMRACTGGCGWFDPDNTVCDTADCISAMINDPNLPEGYLRDIQTAVRLDPEWQEDSRHAQLIDALDEYFYNVSLIDYPELHCLLLGDGKVAA